MAQYNQGNPDFSHRNTLAEFNLNPNGLEILVIMSFGSGLIL